MSDLSTNSNDRPWVSRVIHSVPHVFKMSHVAYFGAAAVGSHNLYAIAAAVILGCMAVGFVFHIELEV